MSCRHDFALGTCNTCYPDTGTLCPAQDDEPNLDGPGAVSKSEARRSVIAALGLSPKVTEALVTISEEVEGAYKDRIAELEKQLARRAQSRQRDQNEPFTREELEQVYDKAKAEGDQLTQQLAGVALDLEPVFEKEQDILRELLSRVKNLLAITPGGDTFAGRVRDQLHEMVKGLEEGDVDEDELIGIQFTRGAPLEMKFKTNWAMKVVAGSLARMLKRSDGTWWNNITFEMDHLGERFYVEVQRKLGKTVKEQLNEANEKLNDANEKLAAAGSRVSELEAELAER